MNHPTLHHYHFWGNPTMRVRLAALLFLTAFGFTSIASSSDDWRTLVNDQVKHSRALMRADTVDVLTISIMLSKDGEEKSRDTTPTRLYYIGDEQVQELYGDDGVLVETKREHRPVGHVSQAGLLSMFDVENADIYTLSSNGVNGDGYLTIAFDPNEPADSLFAGTASIDTSVWFPVRMEMTMSELPDKVKEMDMVAEFVRGEDGGYRPHHMVADGRAKFLLMNFYFRTETVYEW